MTRDKQNFMISELAADWHKLVVRTAHCAAMQCIHSLMDNWTCYATSRHYIALVSRTSLQSVAYSRKGTSHFPSHQA